jgi:exopolysaccharide biosynthesis polyprenyl glycosylphosphotransferase
MAQQLADDVRPVGSAQGSERFWFRPWRLRFPRAAIPRRLDGLEFEGAAARLAASAWVSGTKAPGRAVTMAAFDALCFGLAYSLSYLLRFGLIPLTPSEIGIALGTLALWVGAFASFGLHRPDLLSAPEEFRRTISASSVGTMLVVVGAFGAFGSHATPPRSMVALLWFLTILFELTTRWARRRYEGRLRLSGRLALRTLIIGTDTEAGKLGQTLGAPLSGFAPVGYVATSSSLFSPGHWQSAPLPVVGGLERLENLIEQRQVQCLFVCQSEVTADEMVRLTQVARRHGVEIRVSANIPQTLTSRVAVQQIGDAMALTLRPVRLSGPQATFKRCFDILVATCGLLITLPVWVGIAVAVRLTSPGPVIFRQDRITRGGRRFSIYKFRTMREGSGPDGSLDSSRPFFKLERDPRLTKVGAFLRRSSLDELPQLLNIIRGEMSLVGPRPLAADQVENIKDLERLDQRHEVRAGLTGWWQINGRSDVSLEEALRLDSFYVENWSPSLDLFILLKTIGAVFAGRGAY